MTDNNASKASGITAIINLNARVAFTAENLSGYLLFNLRLIPIYTNNQLRYYHMISAMLDADKIAIKNQLKDHKTSLELINWDGNTQENISIKHNSLSQILQIFIVSHTPRALILNYNNKANSSCFKLIAGHKDIKFNPLDIIKL